MFHYLRRFSGSENYKKNQMDFYLTSNKILHIDVKREHEKKEYIQKFCEHALDVDRT